MQLVALQNLLDNTSFAILFTTMLIFWVHIAFPNLPYLRSLGNAGMAIANLCIAALLGARWIDAGYFPLSNLYESLFFLAWGITTMHIVVDRIGNKSANDTAKRLIGAFTSPMAMGITAFAALALPSGMQLSEPLVPALKSNWLMMHVTVMLLSYAALMTGSILAIAFLIVTRGQDVILQGNSLGTNLRSVAEARASNPETFAAFAVEGMGNVLNSANLSSTTTVALVAENSTQTKKPLSLRRLTLGETLDNLSYRAIGLGFPLLTIGIIAGGVWANEAWGSYWSWDPKETWSLITWLVFAAYLHTRITKGWQGRKPAILASVGLLVVWTCYLGVNLLGKGLHSYGWFL
ncbi:MAG: c-type cytochrome biogenesis protein CcsB [Pseudanabaena sp. M57BS1SP1A06MG]|jgi:cytochrome c-type biogenesis protein CcsB|uniref:c-type cytochrome biogenesis protein CcsB n=1 Tax=Pseudanabaena mucicola TaxID=71190 RepID=UPI0025752542|nr:c-type cytochrome biogenesis protein CcsB [Pseudanabaena mucicola]MCA6573405.1 c-type cytochrome biogenesis protein CcsB [Pseudanabaena sp. M53BS1SP1A06MG]MCA6580450.1 c-type cytochrome biogenesis protein CcsB [Pseudanabaena sp. M34BS1SP1A06MG]MCA6593064.1 c-type cytochrome biogenesis protein CcsB [Pseudanabaena sp. M38BS1SP1A06MG]MCA6594800.1 c-type cytochrome biogenesis protein CcsB [Pseudanabaena sp. M046S1SP1A06QC]MCA6601469.1 c-type cytochrome biogenesis protein CcsB [Pseudanabaena sp.